MELLDKRDLNSRTYINESYTVARLGDLRAKVIEMTEGSNQLTGTATPYVPKRGHSVEIGFEIKQLLIREIDIQLSLRTDHSARTWRSYRPQIFKAKLERFLGQPSLRAVLDGEMGLSIIRAFVSEVASTLEVTRNELRVEHKKFQRSQRRQQDPLDRLTNYVELKLGEIKDPALKETVTAICRTSVLNVGQTRVFFRAVFRQLIEEKLLEQNAAASQADSKTVRALKNHICTRMVPIARNRANDSSKSIAIIPRNPDQPPAHPALVRASERLTDQAQHAFRAITGLEDSKRWNMQLEAACKQATEGRYVAGNIVKASDPRKLPRDINRDPQVVKLFKELTLKVDRELKRINDGAVKNIASYKQWKAAQVRSLEAVVDWGKGLDSSDVLQPSELKITIVSPLLRAHPKDFGSIDEAIKGFKDIDTPTARVLVADLERIKSEITRQRPWELLSPYYIEPGSNSTDRRSSAAHAKLTGLLDKEELKASVNDPRLDPTVGLLFPISEARYLPELRLSILRSALYAQLEPGNVRFDVNLVSILNHQINNVIDNPSIGLKFSYPEQLREELTSALKEKKVPQNRDIRILVNLFAARLTDLAFQDGVRHECDKLRDSIAEILSDSEGNNESAYNQISAMLERHIESLESRSDLEAAQSSLIDSLPTSLNPDQKLKIQTLIEQSGRVLRGVELVDNLDLILARLSKSKDTHKEVVQVVYDLMPIDATGLTDQEVVALYEDRNKVIELFALQVNEVDSSYGQPITSEALAFKVFDIIERRWPEPLAADLGWIAQLVTCDPSQIKEYKAIQGFFVEFLNLEHQEFAGKTYKLSADQSKIAQKAVEDYIDAVVILRADLQTAHQAFVAELKNKLGATSNNPVNDILLLKLEAKANDLTNILSKLNVKPKVKDLLDELKKGATKEQKLLLDTAYKALEIPTLNRTEEQIVKATKVRNQVLELLLTQAKAVVANNPSAPPFEGQILREQLKDLLTRTALRRATSEIQLLATLVTYDPEAVTHYQALKGEISGIDSITIPNPTGAPSKIPEGLVVALQSEMLRLAADYTARKISSDEVALALSAKLSQEIAQLVASNSAIDKVKLNDQLTTACNDFKTALSECIIVPGVDKYQDLIDSQKTAPYLQNLLTSVRDSMPIEVKGLSDGEYLKKLEARNQTLELMLTQAKAVSADRAKPGTPGTAKTYSAMIAEVERLVTDAGYAQAAAPLIKRDLNLIAAIITKDPVSAHLFNKFKETEAKVRECLRHFNVAPSSIVQFNSALERKFEEIVTNIATGDLATELESEISALVASARPEIKDLIKVLSNELANSGYGPVSELDKSNNIMQATLQEINRQHQGRGIVIELELTGRLNGENGILIIDTVTGSRVELRFNHDPVIQEFYTPAAQKEQALIALYSKITNALNYMRAESEIEVPADKGAPPTKHKVQVIPDLTAALNVLGLNSEGASTGADGLIDINNSSIILGPTSIKVGEQRFADQPLATLLESFIPANIRQSGQAGIAKTALIKGEGEVPVYDPVGQISLISFKDKYATQAVLDRFFQRQPVVITFDQGQSYSPANGGFRSSRGPNEVHSVHVNVDKNLAGIVEVLGVVSSAQGNGLEQWRRRYILPEDPKLSFADRKQLIKEIVAQVATNKSTQDFDDYAEGQNNISKLANRAHDTLTNSVIGGMEIINPDMRDGRASISGQDISRGRLEVSAVRRQNSGQEQVKILASNTKANGTDFVLNNGCILVGNNFDAEGAKFKRPEGASSVSIELVLGQGSSLKNVSVQEGVKVCGDVRNVDMTGYQPEELKKLLKLESRLDLLKQALDHSKGTRVAKLATVGVASGGKPGAANWFKAALTKPVRETAKLISSGSNQEIEVDGKLMTKGAILAEQATLATQIKDCSKVVFSLARNLVWNRNTRDDNEKNPDPLKVGLIGYIRKNGCEKEAPAHMLRYDPTSPSEFIKDVAHNAGHSSLAMTAGQELVVNPPRGDVTLRADDERRRVKFELAANHPLLTDNPEVAKEIKETGVKVEDATTLLQALHDYDKFVELCRLINEEELRTKIRKNAGDTSKDQMDMAEMLKRRGIDPSKLPQG